MLHDYKISLEIIINDVKNCDEAVEKFWEIAIENKSFLSLEVEEIFN